MTESAQGAADVNIPHDAASSSEVKSTTATDGTIEIWDEEGHSVHVARGQELYWLNRGFSLQPVDPQAVASEVMNLFRAAELAWKSYLDACVSRGEIDHAAAVTAHTALNALTTRCNHLHLAIHRSYPTPESSPIEMVDTDGIAHRVDPGQEKFYAAHHGWKAPTSPSS